MLIHSTGCGFLGNGAKVKQLQIENDRLLSEFRAQRDRASSLQETNAALEARVAEAEKLLARSGISLAPASRISRAPTSSGASSGNSLGSTTPSMTSSLNRNGNPPPYIPPNVPSLPGTSGMGTNGTDSTTDDSNKWRPSKR